MIDALVRVMAHRCGLEAPDVFRRSRVAELAVGDSPPPFVRRTGRTTRMLLEALVALEVGALVEIVAADPDQARDLAQRLDVLAAKAGYTWLKPRYTWLGRDGHPRGQAPPDVRLVDHHAAELQAKPQELRVTATDDTVKLTAVYRPKGPLH